MPHPFVQFLQAKQRAMKLSDARFAIEVLHVCKSTWSQVQAEGRGIGPKLISGAFRAYPSPEDHAAMSEALASPLASIHHSRGAAVYVAFPPREIDRPEGNRSLVQAAG